MLMRTTFLKFQELYVDECIIQLIVNEVTNENFFLQNFRKLRNSENNGKFYLSTQL